MEPASEEEDEEEQEQQVPPIATTPPSRNWKEESLSRSSSETQASVTSGISLGEVIRQKTAANWGTESWYQLPAEVDASRLTAASETKLGLTCDSNDLTELPTLEEGVLPSASGRESCDDTAHGFLLAAQDSQFSPCFPLLMCSTQGQTFSDEMFLQQSGVDFIPLRGVPDVSGASEECSKSAATQEAASSTDSVSDAPSDCFTLSQHPLPFTHAVPCDTSRSNCLSQQISFSGQQCVSKETNQECRNGANDEALIPQTSKAIPAKATSLSQAEASLAKESCSTSVKDDNFSCDSNVPAAGFELSENENGLVRPEEFSSSENSSCKTVLTKNSEKSERETQKEKVQMAKSESEGCTRQLERLEKEKKLLELYLSNNLPGGLKKDKCKNSGAQGFFSSKASETGREIWKECGVDLNGSESLKLLSVPEEHQVASLDHQQKELSPVVRFEKEELIPAAISTSDGAPKRRVVADMEAPSSCSEGVPGEAEPGVSGNELTSSDFSIERGHKVLGISPSFNLAGDGSFSVHFAHPSYQSTPGILLSKNVKAKELGVLGIKSDGQVSPSCLNEETSGSSSASTSVSVEKQHSLQRARQENNQHFEPLKWKYPHSGRIQSLPSLSFTEKVRAWSVSQLEEVPDSVSPYVPGGASLRRRAYSAIASSSNNILSVPKSSRDPKDDDVASSREAGSLGSSCFRDKNFLLDHPLTRSQSDHSVNVSSRNMSLVEVIPPANSTEVVQPQEETSDVLGNSLGGSMIRKFTAEVVGEDAESTGENSAPNVFVVGEGVAQQLGEDRNSPTEDQKNHEALENQSHNLSIPTGRVSIDQFSDISPDSLNLPVSPGESSQVGLGSAGCSSVVSRHFFPSARDENVIPAGPASLGTPEKEELNIEERIPIYLRNLGIDQSPGTILMPFVPRGPIREVEFSPSELRTLKDSTDMLTRAAPQPQDKLLSAVRITPTSLNFGTSTLNVCIPMDAEAESDVLSLRELSPRFSRSFGDVAGSQRMLCHQLETTVLHSTQREAASAADPSWRLRTASPDCGSDREGPILQAKRIQDLLAEDDSKEVSSSLQRRTISSLAGGKNELEVDRPSQASCVGTRNKSQESESSIGSDALQDIRKILAEMEHLGARWCDASSPETGESSPVLIRKEEDGPKDSGLVKDSMAQLQKILSRDETTARQSPQEEESVRKPLSYNSLRREKSFDVSLHRSEEMVKEMPKELGAGRSVGRAEPEGCSSVTTGINQPRFVGLMQSKGSSEASTLRMSELGNPPSSEPPGSDTDVAGGFQSVFCRAGAARSEAGGTRGSDNSSSGDSLAARVKTLLRTGSPLIHPTQIPKSVGEEERKSRVWVKLKLASQSEESLSDWNEEDLRRTEEIKAELLLRAKESALAKDPWVCDLEVASEYNHDEDVEPSKAPGDKIFQTEKQTPAFSTMELLESSLGQAEPFHRADSADRCLLKDTQFTSLSTVQTPTCNQHQTVATAHSDPVVKLRPLLQERVMHAVSSASDIRSEIHSPVEKRLSMETCPEDMAKQITSITFSSRKRLPSPVTSMTLREGLDGIMPLEVDSVSTEEESHGRQRWDRSKTCPPSSPSLACSMSKEIAFPAEKDRPHHVSAGSDRVGAYQDTECLSGQGSVSIHADQRQSLHAKHSDVLPQGVLESGRQSARLGELDCSTRFSQGTDGFNEPHSISCHQQEKSSPPRCTQLYENLEGADPALQTDLLKGQIKLLEEEKKSPCEEVPLIPKEAAREQIGTSPSSLTKKALSCVHVTLSSQCTNSQLRRGVNTDLETRPWGKAELSTPPMALKTPEALTEAVCKSPAADLVLTDQRSSSYPVPRSSPAATALGLGACKPRNIIDSVVPAKPGKSTSDATTQITTESPGKITFSAEIYVNSRGNGSAVPQSSLQKAHGLPNNTASSLSEISSFPRHRDQPFLLPYKPPGSSGLYYVPYLKAGSTLSAAESEASAESSHSGSNEALPSRLLSNVRGLRDNPPDSTTIEHKEGISRKRAKPKLAWAEEQVIPLEASPERADDSKFVKPTSPLLESARFYLRHPPPERESSLQSNSELSEDSSGVGHLRPSSSAVVPHGKKTHHHQHVFSVRHKDGENEFFPLAAEADYSKNEDLNVSMSLGNETARKELLQHGGRSAKQKAARNYPSPCSQTTRLNENEKKDLPLRERTGSLDELWAKFLECQKRHQCHGFRSNSELSLVERLDRLARVLQNPLKHTLIPTKCDQSVSEKKIKGRDQRKIRLPEKNMPESTLEPKAMHCEDRPRITHDNNTLVELRRKRSGEKTPYHTNKIVEHQQYLETPSDTSSEARLSRDHGTTISSTISESDAVTQTELETPTQTETSSSVSTIDTARLIRAFGHERVRVSPRLSQLYCTINHQKSRSEKWDKGSGKAAGVEGPEVTSERHRKRKETQNAISLSWDSTSASSSSWGPSVALSNKRRTRMLNKGVQAGDLEIVNSATKKNTRDVGVTFPTPRCSQPKEQPQEPWHHVIGISGEAGALVTDHQAAGCAGKQRGQPGNFFVEKRTKRSRLHLPQGISWVVQAEDLKSESRKENHSHSFSGCGPSWFEPWTSTKPWREPLREKNWQEQQHSHMVQPAVPERDADNRALRPFVKLTLQEALAVHRPDFISRSGERVKHLKLVMEERKMQSVLQAQREELFNPPEKRKSYRNASHMLSERGLLLREKRRAIPRSEMVQRSKRIYEQLPEVRKKREEEKRKMEYHSYRLKAQRYKTKITNHVLGRKVPWS